MKKLIAFLKSLFNRRENKPIEFFDDQGNWIYKGDK